MPSCARPTHAGLFAALVLLLAFPELNGCSSTGSPPPPTPGATPPTAPTNLITTPLSSTQINLSWTAAAETGGTITQYLVERCAGTTCSNFVQVGTSAMTTFNDTGLTASTSYSYRVRATDASNNFGPYSNTTSATTPAMQTITFPQPPDTALTAGPVTLTATASSSLAMSYTSTTLPVCTVSGSSVTLVSVGICSITANQAGNATFAAAVQRSSGRRKGSKGRVSEKRL